MNLTRPTRAPVGTRGNNDWEVRLSQPAVLALEDGTIFRGLSIGASGTTVGEVVFNTAMTGYQEILTDPVLLPTDCDPDLPAHR